MPPKVPPKERTTKLNEDAYEKRLIENEVCDVHVTIEIRNYPDLKWKSGEYTTEYFLGEKSLGTFDPGLNLELQEKMGESFKTVYADYVDLIINNELVAEFDIKEGKRNNDGPIREVITYEHTVEMPVKRKGGLLTGTRYVMTGKSGEMVQAIYYHQGHRFEQPPKLFIYDSKVDTRRPNEEKITIDMEYSVAKAISKLMAEL